MTVTKNHLIPAPGCLVRDPQTREPLPPEGKDVGPLTPYWHRRLRDGDVLPAAPTKRTSSRN